MNRRAFLAGAAGVSGLALMGHSPYRKWYQYRARHTVVVTDRSDPGSFLLGERLATHLAGRRPELNATATRAQSPATVLSLLKSRQLELALLRAEDAYQGFHGTGSYADVRTPLRALAALAPEYLYLLVPATAAIRMVADLKERRVGIVENGGRARLKAERVVTAAGLDPETALRWFTVTAEESVAALARGEIDACFVETATLAPAQALPRGQLPLELRAVGHGETVDALIARHGPIYFKAAPGGDTGPGLSVDSHILGEVRVLVCRDDYPAERARAIVEALEGWDEMAPAGTPVPIPAHPVLLNSGDARR